MSAAAATSALKQALQRLPASRSSLLLDGAATRLSSNASYYCVQSNPLAATTVARAPFSSATAALDKIIEVLDEEPISVVLCDQRMPEMTGDAFFAEARRRRVSSRLSGRLSR